MATAGRGVVKYVQSGDTIIVMGNASNGPPPEKTLTLEGIITPRLNYRKGGPADEPFAWESREYLRKKCIGKQVSFQIVSSGAGREFAVVKLEEEDLAHSMVAAGWAKAKAAPKDNADENRAELAGLMASAEAAGLGLWTKHEGKLSKAVRDVQYEYDAKEVLNLHKDRPTDAVIEYVRDGSFFRVIILGSFHVVPLFLAGVQTPGFRRQESGDEIAQPFAREAKFFTESRLLHRDVKVKLHGLDKFDNFYGDVLHPAGHIGEQLVVNGLAKVADWSLAGSTDAAKLRLAEKSAKDKRLRIWKDWTPPTNLSTANKLEFQGKVTEVVSGDTIVVQDTTQTTPVERKIRLSSIRAPNQGNARREVKPEPFAWEAKEYLRKALAGKRVKVNIEYSRPANNEKPDQGSVDYGTVTVREKNVAVSLVNQGLASVVRHRSDEERSSAYDDLLAAEAQAQQSKVGKHSGKTTTQHINDLTGANNAQKAKHFLSYLQKSKRVEAVVDFVMNGSRMKVFVPKESCVITVALAGLKCPSTARRDGTGKSEKWGTEAAAYTKDRVFQQSIELEVESCDRSGTFISSIFTSDKKNLATELLGNGLAFLIAGSADRSPYSNELHKAADDSKQARRGVYEDWTEEDDAVDEPAFSTGGKQEVINAVVSEVVNGGTVYIQAADENTKANVTKMNARELPEGACAEGVRAGQLLYGRFSQDNLWYRAKVEKVDLKVEPPTAIVQYIDYGNREEIDLNNLRPMDPAFAATKPQAQECHLAHIRCPELEDDNGYGVEAAGFVSEAVMGRDLLVRVEGRDKTSLYVTILDAETKDNLNKEIIRNGLATVKKRGVPPQVAAQYKAEEELAKADRLCLWEYGDAALSDDEAPEFGVRK